MNENNIRAEKTAHRTWIASFRTEAGDWRYIQAARNPKLTAKFPSKAQALRAVQSSRRVVGRVDQIGGGARVYKA